MPSRKKSTKKRATKTKPEYATNELRLDRQYLIVFSESAAGDIVQLLVDELAARPFLFPPLVVKADNVRVVEVS